MENYNSNNEYQILKPEFPSLEYREFPTLYDGKFPALNQKEFPTTETESIEDKLEE